MHSNAPRSPSVHRGPHRAAAWILLGTLIGALPAGSAAAGAASPQPPVAAAATLSGGSGLPTWPASPDWQGLVPGPSSDDVKPVSVVRTHGSVTNPQALTGAGGSAVMTVEPGGRPAVVVLDYGHEVGGTPYVTVSANTPSAPATSTTVRISTSEALPFLTANATTTLSRDAAAGDAEVKVASVAPFYP
jgi:hypothetical protein